ncbi:methylmalonyl Co-A mutase-associated GTPase MeaB [Breoghania sp. L-A4]|uniref:methylmalonyl Co-A mutase-associated GTPase MeaB n=1 Tax=Breoghania sp. L-A4 TaxID=2304600 RepID=UPI000E35AEF8|nr:methylmalonyl Co-A mutase-associated GTPase MeaB [Breoghania sp. L-A4]AXS41128.1 methylmalonyl Co-A mutase-associated GTPase MeaB [Breoghania sp. L-A4]
MSATDAVPDIETVRAGGKPALARALAQVETAEGSAGLALFLDKAASAARAHVLGLTGPPGVGKSTLTNALIRQARAQGKTVGVIAVDPSSRVSGGALLGDRTRLATDPEDDGIFVRSMAARDRLGGLSDHAIAAVVVMRAVMDLVIVETVGIGQSEADIAHVADTVVLCIQPGSGDSLQFMKAGVMEMPDVFAVTKADMGEAARRARADVEGALTLARPTGFKPPVVLLSASSGDGLEDLAEAIEAHRAWLAGEDQLERRRAGQARAWIIDAIRQRWGSEGLARADLAAPAHWADGDHPFQVIRQVDDELRQRFDSRNAVQ